MNGLINLAFPFLEAIDGGMALALPLAARIVAWAVLSGIVTMLLYRLLSNQARIKAGQAEAKAQRQAMRGSDEPDEALRLAMQNLRTSMAVLGHVIGPALVSALPVLLVMGWLVVTRGYLPPVPGDAIAYSAEPADAGVTAEPSAGPGLIRWPDDPASLVLATPAGPLVQGLPAAPTLPEIHKYRWWSLLLGNPSGYLPADGPVERVGLELRPLELWSAGPSWARGWELTYILVLFIVSLAIKLGFRIA